MKKKKMSVKERRSSTKDRMRNVKDVATWVDASQPARKQKEDVRPERHVRYAVAVEESESTTSSLSTLVETPKYLDGGYGWAIVIYSFLLHFIADGITFSFGMIFHNIVHRFGVARWLASTIGSVFLALPLLLGPIAGIITEKFGCKVSILIGKTLSIVGTIISCFALYMENVYGFLIGFGFCLGSGLSFIYNAAIVIVSIYFDNRQGTATSLAVSGTGVGTMAFPQFINWLVTWSPNNSTVWLCFFITIMLFASALICFFWIEDPEWNSDDVEYKRKMFDRRVRQLDRELNDEDEIEIDDEGLQRRAYSVPNMTTLGQLRGSIIDLGISLQSIKDTVNMSKKADGPPPPRSRSVGTFMRKNLAVIPEYTMITQDELGHLDHLDLQMGASPANTIHCKPRIRMLSKTSMSVDAINEMEDDASIVKIGFSSGSEDDLDGSESGTESDSDLSNDGESSESELSDRILNKTNKMANGTVANVETGIRKVESARQPRPSFGTGHNAPGRVLVGSAALGYRTRTNTNMIAFQGKVPSAPLLAHRKRRWYNKYEVLQQTVDAIMAIPKEFPIYVEMMQTTYRFTLYLLSVALLYCVLDVPYVFFYDYAVDTLKISDEEAKNLPSVIGFFNLISTWIIGFISDAQFMRKRLFVFNGFAMLGVAACMFGSSYATTSLQMMIICGGFGFFISSNYVLQSVLLGLLFPDVSKFMSSYSLTSGVEGVATLVGPPVIGLIRDLTGDYRTVFFVSGAMVTVSAFLSFAIHTIMMKKSKEYNNEKEKEASEPLCHSA